MYIARIKSEHPHDKKVYTQGLFFANGHLYESSGGFGESFLSILDPQTGTVIHSQSTPRKYFAEGITQYNGKIFMLTWLSGTGFIHSMDTLELMASFAYRQRGDSTEGWGLTYDETNFILSSGKATLHFHRPDDFALVGSVTVKDGNRQIRMLNELEYVGGMILANVWKSDTIAIIAPKTGIVQGWIDLTPLRTRLSSNAGVANGIAYDKKTGTLYVTGKHWDKLFEIVIDEMLWRRPVNQPE